jgi:hypothetical protein
MRKLPALATSLLVRLGPPDEAFIGDLAEEYGGGRSRAWYWRQVLSAVVLTSLRQIGNDPLRTLAAVAVGWATTLMIFFVLGDRTADGLAGWFWNWDRQTAYRTNEWRPFTLTASFVSYTGFGLSALAVVRLHRRDAGPALIAYAASMLFVMAASALVVDVLARRYGAVPVPHTLFYVVSVALPYHWRSGLLLAPLVVLVAGVLGCPRSNTQARLSRG